MKKIILSLLALSFSFAMSGQQVTKQDYLKKSNNQNTWAWVLAGGGAALVMGGALVLASDASYFPSETVGPILIASGAASIAGGIILFSASKRNERKANEMAVSFNLKVESATRYQDVRITNNYYPACSLRISLK